MPKFCIGVPILKYEEQFKYVFSSIVTAVEGFDYEIIIGIQNLDTIPKNGAEDILGLPKVRAIDSSNVSTLSGNLNNIIEQSNSPYFVRIDDDDYMHPYRISKLARTIEENPNFAIIGQSYKMFAEGKKAGRIISPLRENASNKQFLLFGVPFAHPAITINLDKIEGRRYDPEMMYAQDYMFYIDNLASGEFIGTRDMSLYYRVPNQNKLGYLRKRKIQLHCHEKAMIKLWNKVLKVNINEEEIHRLRCLYVSKEFCNNEIICSGEKKHLEIKYGEALSKMKAYLKGI
jgi:glycosyltransferase involved in cell wall biosynthesis